MGCNDMIILITDGAPDFFKNIFEKYNSNKLVRSIQISSYFVKCSRYDFSLFLSERKRRTSNKYAGWPVKIEALWFTFLI